MLYKKKCALCEKEFMAKHPSAKFCSPVCYREAMRRLNRLRNRGKEYRKKVIYPATKRWLKKRGAI
jgi:predicted RNA-binding Zn-ribbon protein involved in translation (DUF1610 family)